MRACRPMSILRREFFNAKTLRIFQRKDAKTQRTQRFSDFLQKDIALYFLHFASLHLCDFALKFLSDAKSQRRNGLAMHRQKILPCISFPLRLSTFASLR